MRRWREHPLSLLSKIVVAALLGIFGAIVTLGIGELGNQLDIRLKDSEVLTAIITESFDSENSLSHLDQRDDDSVGWDNFGTGSTTIYQVSASARTNEVANIPILAFPNLELEGMADDFYYINQRFSPGTEIEFQVGEYSSVATVIRPIEDLDFLLLGRPAIIGSVERLSLLLGNGFIKTVVLRADSISELSAANEVTKAILRIEGRRVVMRSNLSLLKQLEEIRALQSQALVIVAFCSAIVLGLVFGSLAWLEFREERYLLALIRSFGVSPKSLLIHSVMENTVLSVLGVFFGLVTLHFIISQNQLGLRWLSSLDSPLGTNSLALCIGAILGGLLSVVPVGIGLRKPLGLVLT